MSFKKLFVVAASFLLIPLLMGVAPGMLGDRVFMEQLGISTKGDSTGTPGNATLNTGAGKSAIAIGASTVTITNSRAAATTVVIITPIDRDATCLALVADAAAGSFTVTCAAAATAATKFNWLIIE